MWLWKKVVAGTYRTQRNLRAGVRLRIPWLRIPVVPAMEAIVLLARLLELLLFFQARGLQIPDRVVDVQQSTVDPLSNVVITDECRCIVMPVPQSIQQTVDQANRGIIVSWRCQQYAPLLAALAL